VARNSAIRTVLERFSKRDLQEFVEHHELFVTGAKDDLVKRLVGYHDRDLEDLMTRGPWPLVDWNDFAEVEFGCARRNSYVALAKELGGEGPPSGRSARPRKVRLDPSTWDFERMTFDELDEALDEILRSEPDGATPPAAESVGSANSRPPSPSAGRPDLHENELFFLQFSGLAWPVSLGQVRAAYQDAVMLLHPDRHPSHAATATEKMKRINDGWKRLKSRLEG